MVFYFMGQYYFYSIIFTHRVWKIQSINHLQIVLFLFIFLLKNWRTGWAKELLYAGISIHRTHLLDSQGCITWTWGPPLQDLQCGPTFIGIKMRANKLLLWIIGLLAKKSKRWEWDYLAHLVYHSEALSSTIIVADQTIIQATWVTVLKNFLGSLHHYCGRSKNNSIILIHSPLINQLYVHFPIFFGDERK